MIFRLTGEHFSVVQFLSLAANVREPVPYRWASRRVICLGLVWIAVPIDRIRTNGLN